MDSTGLLIGVVVAVAVLGAVWFGVRFWLASTRPVDIKDVHTPALDRLNRQALERGAADDEEEEEVEEEEALYVDEEAEEEDDDAAPKGLTDVVPEDKRK